ncbi:MAG: polyhydroxyalkanoic acid system family protein [Planctomycetes bacterium]|nr:polyhydroxyalkanoic acid system family protein [Planctomycetota bacterium]
MKAIEVRVPHTLERDEVRRRLDDALVRAREQYAAAVGDIEASWEGEDRLRVLLTVSGMKFDGTVEILVEELVVALQVPGMAALFAGRIREGIEERLGGLIGSQQA